MPPPPAHEETQEAPTFDLRDLITPELIARARASFDMQFKQKYAEVIDARYTVKFGPRISDYEYRVLQFLETIPDIPSPRPIGYFDMDVAKIGSGKEVQGTEVWHVIVMSTIPGQTLGTLLRSLAREDIIAMLRESMRLVDLVDTTIGRGVTFPGPDGIWRPLQRPSDSISNLDGDQGRIIELPLYQNVMQGSVHVNDFVTVMSGTCPQPLESRELLNSTLQFLGPQTPSDIRFCHMDLHYENIMVQDGHVSGIIDWELCGWFTWRLEVLGGLRQYLGPKNGDVDVYSDAWDIPIDLRQIISRSIPRIKWGAYVERKAKQKPERSAGQDPAALQKWRERQRQKKQAATVDRGAKSPSPSSSCTPSGIPQDTDITS